MTTLIDGKNAVLGRLATFVANELLSGGQITIVNSEEIIITGSPKKIVGKYLARRRRGSPQHGPFFPKRPDLIVKRTIGCMLPKGNKGKASIRRLRVHIGVPDEFNKKEMKTIAVKTPKTDFIRVGELSKTLGWKE